MQAAGQYGEAPQFNVASRVGAASAHGQYMFNLSHDISLSSSTSSSAQAAAGHGVSSSSLQAPAPQAQASQQLPASLMLSSPSPPSFLPAVQQDSPSLIRPQQQQQQQQQQERHGFNTTMAGAAASTVKTASSTAGPTLVHSQKSPQASVQQLQEDIKPHHRQLLQQIPHSQQQQAIGEPAQQKNPSQEPGIAHHANDQRHHQQQSGSLQGSAPASDIGSPSHHAVDMGGGSKGPGIRREEQLDGDEQDDEGEKGSAGINRWPRQEALALLKIRSDMDAAFRDSSIKAPLWEEISRKLAEMGYQRSAKKCKEKFENVHKYYKRTKVGKTGRQDGKSYRFFLQLEALYGKTSHSTTPLINLSTIKTLTNPSNININKNTSNINHNSSNINNNSSNINHNSSNINHNSSNINNNSTNINHISSNINNNSSSINHFISRNASNSNVYSNNHGLLSLYHGGTGSAAGVGLINPANGVPFSSPFPLSFNPASSALATNAHIARTLDRVESLKHESADTTGPLHFFIETSEDDDDDDDEEDDDDDEDGDDYQEPAAACKIRDLAADQDSPNPRKRKAKPMKKYLAFFEKVMKQVLDKQELMQQKLLEAMERREHDRMIRDEAWKRQEMARLHREHDVRAAERALSASREASLITFLQNITGQSIPLPHIAAASMAPAAAQAAANPHCSSTALLPADHHHLQNECCNTDKDPYDPSNKRWPKPEVLTLIKLRTSLDRRFHEPGSKAVLWDEISAAMAAQGFARTSRRCKEKWENINKYFRKAKESKKKRPENAKTCPYFHHLNALYKEGLLGAGGGGSDGGGRGGSSMISSKQLLVTVKGEDQSGDIMKPDQQGNHGGNSRLGDEEEGAGGAVPIIPADVEKQRSTTKMIITAAADMVATASPNLAVGTGTTSSDAKMHMFMGSVGSEQDGIQKAVICISSAMDSSIAASTSNRTASAMDSFFPDRDQGVTITASLSSSGLSHQPEQSQAA